jgi:hypothetical protein
MKGVDYKSRQPRSSNTNKSASETSEYNKSYKFYTKHKYKIVFFIFLTLTLYKGEEKRLDFSFGLGIRFRSSLFLSSKS